MSHILKVCGGVAFSQYVNVSLQRISAV